MLKPVRYNVYPHILTKISQVVRLLQMEKEKYEHAALTVENTQLRNTIRCLAQENNQYANELLCQLAILGVRMDETIHKTVTPAETLVPLFPAGNNDRSRYHEEELLIACCESEKEVIAAYRDILNEPFLAAETRRVMRYQLNGIMYAFLQLKLLKGTLA